MDCDSDSDGPSDYEEAAKALSEKSKHDCETAFKEFEKWCEEKKVKDIDEKVLLAYFEYKKNIKVSTLWTTYSMLKTQLSEKGIDIREYANLIAFLKVQSAGQRANKSYVFSKEDITKFLVEASDNNYLLAKVVLIMGIAGACIKSELTFLRLKDVTNEDNYFRVKIQNTKTNVNREFIITEGNVDGLNFVEFIKKYINLRPENLDHDRFFLKYNNGKCSVQPVGINAIQKMPKMIATRLCIPNAKLFKGHCFRRTSAALLANCGANIFNIKQYRSRKLNSVEKSIENKELMEPRNTN